jgi:ATP-dependent Clp protease ATP-binding subunit ClpB
VDETVLFKPLTLSEITGIVKLLIQDLEERLGQQDIGLAVAQEAAEFISREGFDPVYGARPLKRFIQQHLETPISRRIISGNVPEGAVIAVDVADDQLQIL